MIAVDESPTAQGARWYCNACTFSTPSKDQAVAHATEKRTTVYNHMLYERVKKDGPTTRRVAVYANGHIQTETKPPRGSRR